MDINSKVSFTRNLYQVSKEASRGFTDVEADLTGFPRKKLVISQQTIDGLNANDLDDLYNEFADFRTGITPKGGQLGTWWVWAPNGCTYGTQTGINTYDQYLGQTNYTYSEPGVQSDIYQDYPDSP